MIKVDFADVFKGLKDNVVPVIHPARRVPHSLLDKLKHCLDTNLQCGVLQKVDQPTDWVHSLVIVEKKNGTLHLCLDPRDLNKAVKCGQYRIPTVQEISSHLAGKKIFSTLDPQRRLLAGGARQSQLPAVHIQYTIWLLSFYSHAVWSHLCK